jgi:hypothetical protein
VINAVEIGHFRLGSCGFTGTGSASEEGNGKHGLQPRFWLSIISELLAKSSALRASIYDASALNNFARLSMSAALASPITK